jgi:malonyl CoA-acyl carrier protein transacylase
LLLAAAPSNKITVNSVTKKKKKGTATINAKVPGPGQVTLNQANTPPDVNATAAAVKQVGLTITQASSFKLAVKPVGKTAKKLKKQLKKKNKAKVKVKVFIHFVPAGVAGVPNSKQQTVALVKQRKKK